MADLIAPHGGLKEPFELHRRRPTRLDAFKAEAAKLAKVPVSDADLSTVYRFGDGALSPLPGPDGFGHLQPRARRIGHRARRQALCLDDSARAAGHAANWRRQLKPGQKVALTNSAGAIVATLDISDVFEWDKPKYIKSVYLTERTDHPGADMVLKGDADKTHLIGGTIRVLPQPKHPKFGKYVLSPREVRKLLAGEGLEPRRRLPDPQPAAPGPRVRAGLRPGNAAPGRAQRRRRASIR